MRWRIVAAVLVLGLGLTLTVGDLAHAKASSDSDYNSRASGTATIVYSVGKCNKMTSYKLTYVSFSFDRKKSATTLTFDSGAWWTGNLTWDCSSKPVTKVSVIKSGTKVSFGRNSSRPNHAEYTFSPNLPYVTNAAGNFSVLGSWAKLHDNSGGKLCLSAIRIGYQVC